MSNRIDPMLQPVVDALVEMFPGIEFEGYSTYQLPDPQPRVDFTHPWVQGCVAITSAGLICPLQWNAFPGFGIRRYWVAQGRPEYTTGAELAETLRAEVLRIARDLAAPYTEAIAALAPESIDTEIARLRAELARVNVCDRDVLPRFKGRQAARVFERTLNGGGFRGETPAEMDAMLARHVAWARDVCPASDACAPW